MKRIVLLLTLALLCAALLAGCGCKHENVNEGGCETAKTCADCGEKLAEAPGHTWLDATCEAPKTCSACQKTEGQALGHTWEEATTEAPKTCTACQKTEGERIITDERFTTAACKDLFGTWICDLAIGGEAMGLEGFDGSMNVAVVLTLTNDGKMIMDFEVATDDAFVASLRSYMTELLYAELEAVGVKREDADAYLQSNLGMGMDAYVDTMVQMADFEAAFEAIKMEGNYYVSEGQIYTGLSWSNMTGEAYTLSGDTLNIGSIPDSLGVAEAPFIRVKDTEE